MSHLKKTLYTLNLNPDDYKDITDLTFPWLKHFAKKCGAEFFEIRERKFPEWPPNFEKLQIYELGQKHGNDWNIFFDCDALVHPDTPDYTELLNKDTVAHNGSDFAPFRFKYDRFYKRDGRHIGSATWCCIASDWCIEMFEPPTDITPEQVTKMIFPTANELHNGVAPIRLVEDFLIGRNIAKYGLKYISIKTLMKNLNLPESGTFFHIYAVPKEQKVLQMKEILKGWGLS